MAWRCLLLSLMLISPLQAQPRNELPTAFGRDFYLSVPADPRVLPPRQSAPDAQAWLDRIEQQQWRGGPYHADLSETLIDAANYFYGRGDLERAVTLRKRAVHVTRVNDGLYSELQLPLLRQLLETYMATGQREEADAVQSYLFHLYRENYQPGDTEYVAATIDYTRWQRAQWLLNPDPENPKQLFKIWTLLDRQIRESEQGAGLGVDALEPLVYEQLRMLYLIGVSDLGLDREAEMLMGGGFGKPNQEPGVERSQLQYLQQSAYSRGKKRLQDLAARLGTGADPVRRALVHRQLGDWHLWYGRQRAAAGAYGESWALLSAAEATAEQTQWYGEPVELPAGGVLWPGPDAEAFDELVRVRASFEVSHRGRVKNVEAQALAEDREGMAWRVQRLLRATRFRPRLEAGEMVDSERLEREYQIN